MILQAFRGFRHPTPPLSRPGGAQAELLAEVNKHESDRNLDLVLEEFRNYQQGILPAGLGARSLTEFFAGIGEKLDPTAATAPRTQSSGRDVLNLLTKRGQAQRAENEIRIRAAKDRLLCGDTPPRGKCDVKTLASEAAVDRTAFYGTRPYSYSTSSSNDA
ncbi:hypothetical protein [Streptomyces jumonjinensis]|uniref:hypothetical protein n=1 Tax=Streptomyces jumonjinensis TaxID=1945 RepID=UPI001E5F0B67|nr:hypothetical protein [Streptomyces jumonjinensis]